MKQLIRRVGLLRDLTTTKLENCTNVEAYVNKVVTTAHKLEGIGMKISDEMVASLLLSGLPTECQPMIMALESASIDITTDLVKTKILQAVRTCSSTEQDEAQGYLTYNHTWPRGGHRGRRHGNTNWRTSGGYRGYRQSGRGRGR